MILFNGESQLIFNDKNDASKMFGFDIEKQKVVLEFQAADK